jgi:hypothetical protein
MYLPCSFVVQASQMTPQSEAELLSETVENEALRVRPGVVLLPVRSSRNHRDREKP